MRGFLERHFAAIDLAVVLLASGLIFIWSHWLNRDAALLSTLGGNRVAVYGAVAGLFGTIFGFALTAMSNRTGCCRITPSHDLEEKPAVDYSMASFCQGYPHFSHRGIFGCCCHHF